MTAACSNCAGAGSFYGSPCPKCSGAGEGPSDRREDSDLRGLVGAVERAKDRAIERNPHVNERAVEEAFERLLRRIRVNNPKGVGGRS
jgi:hypothetical protein